MYGVLFQSYADKVSFYRSKSELISRLSERKSTYVTEYFFVWEKILMYVKERIRIFTLLLLYFQKQWEEGLQAMDQAINDMPRTKHRLYV